MRYRTVIGKLNNNMQKTSMIKSLFQRRVPQILGLYIAATWMMIEIGDWIVERFLLSPEITSYIFIGMAVFLPSVCYLAYQYGQPGPDPWKKPTFIIVPGNLLLAVAAMFYFVNPVVATETRVVIDEKGVQQSFEVPKAEYRKKLISFFWQNQSGDSELDWLQYGLPWMLNKDLDRSLFISGNTPFGDSSMFQAFNKAGFSSGLKVPNALQLKLARQDFFNFSLTGAFNKNGDEYELTVQIYKVDTGEKLATHRVTGVDYLPLIDELSSSIRDSLEIPQTLDEQSNDLPITEHISESKLAIRKRVESNIKAFIENDYAGAKQLLQEAIAEDFSFADAYARLARINQLMGSGQEASEALANAMQHEYKFTPQDQFLYRAMAYGLRGDYTTQVKVYDMWLELEPDNVEAHEYLASILLVTGLNSDKALSSLKRLRELKPTDDSVLLKMAQLFQLNQQTDKALKSLNQYIQQHPKDISALNELADIYQRAADFDNARETLNKILLLDRQNLAAEIKLNSLEIKLGNFQSAESQLQALLANAASSQEKFQIYAGMLNLYRLRGQINKCIEILVQMESHAEHLPPIAKIFNLQFTRSFFLTNTGKFEAALDTLDQVRSQLQPPLDGIVDVGAVTIYVRQKDQEKLQQVIEKLEAYLRQYPNPMFTSILDNSKAELAELQGDFIKARELHESSLEAVEKTIVNSRDELTILMQKASLARTRTKAGELDIAEKELIEILNIHPSLPVAHLALAENYFAQEKLVQAQESLARLATIWQNADEDYFEYQNFLALKAALSQKLAQ